MHLATVATGEPPDLPEAVDHTAEGNTRFPHFASRPSLGFSSGPISIEDRSFRRARHTRDLSVSANKRRGNIWRRSYSPLPQTRGP
jgi:hypothetical protein